jgi:hypothetical protein
VLCLGFDAAQLVTRAYILEAKYRQQERDPQRQAVIAKGGDPPAGDLGSALSWATLSLFSIKVVFLGIGYVSILWYFIGAIVS